MDRTAQQPDALKGRIDIRLDALMTSGAARDGLVAQAMRHALTSPGKRFRPVVTLLTVQQFGGDVATAIDPACAIEMIHAASLILDDLPSMDDAARRRGLPTTHRLFGEDMAILASIALLTRAFAVVTATTSLANDTKLGITARLADAAGLAGLVGGQEIDLRCGAELSDRRALRDLNRRKTGALIGAAVDVGLLVASVDGSRADKMRDAADHIGEVFQTVDDILDVTADQASVGKDVRQDGDKPTLVSVDGVAATRNGARFHMEQAVSLIDGCSPVAPALAPYLRTVFEPHLNG